MKEENRSVRGEIRVWDGNRAVKWETRPVRENRAAREVKKCM